MMKDRIAGFRKAGPGLFNFCLYSDSLGATYRNLRASGIRAAPPKTFSSDRSDGVKISWQLIGTRPYDLPFIIGRYTPERVADSASLQHRNGAIGIDSLYIATTEFDRYVKWHNSIYSQPPLVSGAAGYRSAAYDAGSQIVVLSEAPRITGRYTKPDKSVPVRFTLRCATGGNPPRRLNEYITLTE